MDDDSDINARAFVRIMAAVGERIRVAQRRTEVQRFLPGVAAHPAFRRLSAWVEDANCGRFNAFEVLVDGILVANLVTLGCDAIVFTSLQHVVDGRLRG